MSCGIREGIKLPERYWMGIIITSACAGGKCVTMPGDVSLWSHAHNLNSLLYLIYHLFHAA